MELGLLSVWMFHVLPVPVWISSGFSGFLQPLKNMQRWTGSSKLPLGGNACVLCPAMNWSPTPVLFTGWALDPPWLWAGQRLYWELPLLLQAALHNRKWTHDSEKRLNSSWYWLVPCCTENELYYIFQCSNWNKFALSQDSLFRFKVSFN